ncbi:hypothetical protein OS188_13770 [Xanthomarina sp. F1114]|uniref:hypothetical protein n=1 Tax=Xanthomarina sp. F1114 TaxID=2996019 RepID=UPI00225E159E|nr:hypothetical protein [Xanthomarina sp. F1114]MCX7549019.1 hypothetical protein [Xanthomarina sp. F1114]
MNIADYKNEAHNLYRDDKLIEAYKCAWNLPFTDFVSWYTDVKGKRKQSKGISLFNDSFFYNSFLISQSTEWLNHKEANLLWEYYLNTQKEILLEFELYVAHNNPCLFIEGYKNRLIFLNDKRIKQLQEHHLPLSIENELIIWNRFNKLLNTKWKEVTELIDEIELQPHEFLMALCATFEAFIYKNPADKLRWHYAVEALSLLIAYIQNNFILSNLEVDENDLVKAYCNGAIDFKCEAVFSNVFDYVLLKEKTQRYAYEPGLTIVIDNNDILRFNGSEAFNKQWNTDELRYTVNEQHYYAISEQLFSELKAKNKIKYINNNKDPNNQLGNIRQLGVKLTVTDLGICDEDLKNKKLPNLDFMISFLHGIAWRKFETSEKPLHEIARIRKNEYAKGMAELIYKNEVSEFILISDNSILKNAAKASGLNCTTEEFDQFINAFSFSWKKKTFDPFKLPLSLWKKPFLQIGKHIISPISVLTGFTGVYTISESILKNFSPRGGERIESLLKHTYENAGWKTSVITNNQEYGDVDVMMEDEDNIIFMQLKRTTQKTNMLELHNQLAQDRKAIKQLLEAKAEYTSSKNIHLWYVTTAFEKVSTWEKEVYRVSYQDLIHVKRLLDSDGLRFNNLNDFIEMIESDTPYKIGKEHILN